MTVYFIEFYQSWPGKGANKLQRLLVLYNWNRFKTIINYHYYSKFKEVTLDALCSINYSYVSKFYSNYVIVRNFILKLR